MQLVWSGAVTPTGAVVKARLASGTEAQIVVSESANLSNPAFQATEQGKDDNILTFQPTGLKPNTRYYYGIKGSQVAKAGRFRTAPAPKTDFEFVSSACAGWNGPASGVARKMSDSYIFKEIPDRHPNAALFLHLGDLHYRDTAAANVESYRNNFRHVHQQALGNQNYLYERLPIAYVWDDHDNGPDNADSTHIGQPYVNQAYREYVPHYPIQKSLVTGATPTDGQLAIAQTYALGSVRFIMLDARSHRLGADFLGSEQLVWLKETLGAATEPVIVITSGVPWVGGGLDYWGGAAEQRADIANFLMAESNRKNGVLLNDRVVLITGDAHMLACDSGLNSQYATVDGTPTGTRLDGAQFPGPAVFATAALDSNESIKGGPYTNGQLKGTGQYGHFAVSHITDAGVPKIKLTFTGYRREAVAAYTTNYTTRLSYTKLFLDQDYPAVL
ncbi:alkaline phosphatase D family protein [Rufibacter latericius]|uniref:alkaline phosphatase D family protein n=1 Tax=Rufibacter latericius TaxID=2487040 RepID=UPI001404092A|nr:alkaline phosphatase D family protein [Rufibacter latericius]